MGNLKQKLPLRICLTYLLVGVVWMLVSDQLITRFAQDTRQLILFARAKDLVFILTSAVLLLFYVGRQLRHQDHANTELKTVNAQLRQQHDLLDSVRC